MTRTIRVTEKCTQCDGDGYTRSNDEYPSDAYQDSGCPACGGSGSYCSDPNAYKYSHSKPKQNLRKGSGKVSNEYEVTSETCSRCSGDKYVTYWTERFAEQEYESILGRSSWTPNPPPPTVAQLKKAEAFLREHSRRETCDLCHGTGFKLQYLRSSPMR